MINLRIDFKCILCGNTDKWYFMPEDEKTQSGDKISSLTKHKIKCKKCGQDYLLSFKISKYKEYYDRTKY